MAKSDSELFQNFPFYILLHVISFIMSDYQVHQVIQLSCVTPTVCIKVCVFPCPVNMWANIIRYTTKAKYSNAVQKRSILHLQDKIFPNSCFVSLHGRFFTKFLYRVSLLRKFIMWLAFTNVLMFVKPNLQQQTVYRAYRPTSYRAASI